MNQTTSQAGSSSCQCFDDIVWDAKGNDELCAKIIQRQLKSVQKDFLAVIGLSGCLDPKRSGTKLTMANQSKIPVIRYSDVPAPGREDNPDQRMKDNDSLQRKYGEY